MLDTVEKNFRSTIPKVDFCSMRFISEQTDMLSVRQDVVEPVQTGTDAGAMITVVNGGGIGYGATSDLSADGLARAAEEAAFWAKLAAKHGLIDYRTIDFPHPVGEYTGPEQIPYNSVPLQEKLELLRVNCKRIKIDARIVDWQALLHRVLKEQLYLTSGGGRAYQRFKFMLPILRAVANEGTETQQRTFKAHGGARQGGMEALQTEKYQNAPETLAREALELLAAPNCPSETMDVLLAPDQMILQLHESVCHPLELDRILGDERNYAGTSFVTPEMFGTYQYGSELLNVTFDPTREIELASYAWDDEGMKAEKHFLIEKGVLKRGLGAMTSQKRSGIPGVANARASSWNRPPIDRMANINIEPGTISIDNMIASVKRGIFMTSNKSWSIDDSRNKFQFGCEWGQLIEDGKLATVVKNPNYRGISANFWRNLKMVGNEDTFEILGTPNCGKGEPNQMARAGHASPACLFENVSVFGGEQGK